MKRKQTTITSFIETKKVKKEYRKDLGQGCFYSYNSQFILNHEEIFQKLKEEIMWKKVPVIIMGKEIMQPRLVSFISDENNSIEYTNITMKPDHWTKTILELKELVEKELKTEFNAVYCNLYRNGKDYIGYHSDDVKSSDKNTLIASLSFGINRKFYLKHKKNEKNERLVLEGGSLFVMEGNTQEYWKHSVPKEKHITEERINLTFRKLNYFK